MKELDPDLYREKLARVGRRYDVFTAWVALAIAAFLFVGFAVMSDSNDGDRCAPRLQDPATYVPNPHRDDLRGDGDWSLRADRQDLDTKVGPETASEGRHSQPPLSPCS